MLRRLLCPLTCVCLIGAAVSGVQAAPSARAKPAPAVKKAPRPELKPLTPVSDTSPRVSFETTVGTITFELYPDKAPITVRNFVQYAKEKQYEGTLFHRVIPGFVIQGGGFTTTYQEKPTRDPIVSEADNGLENVRGSLALARTIDPDSGAAQFFINLQDNPRLDFPNADGNGYTVFGRVIAGMDVVDRIALTPTGTKTMRIRPPQGEPEEFRLTDVPRTQVVIKSVSYQIPEGSLDEPMKEAGDPKTPVAPYRDDQPKIDGIDVDAITEETQKSSSSPGRLTLVWWIPEDFWRASFADDKTISKVQAEEFMGIIRPYTTVIVVDGTLGGNGTSKFRREAEIRAELKLRGADGSVYSPYRASEIGEGSKALLETVRPMLAGLLGPMGESMYIFQFPARDKNEKPIVDPKGTGHFTVAIGPREYRYRLPLASLLPHRKCSTCEEVLSGAYKVCPYDGTKLGDEK